MIKEDDQKDDDEEEESAGNGSIKDGEDVMESGVKVGEKVKSGVKKYVRSRGVKKHIVIDAPATLEPKDENKSSIENQAKAFINTNKDQ